MLVIINIIANMCITIAVSLFMVFVFGRLSLLVKLPTVEQTIVKCGLALIASGSFLNTLTCSKPSITEVILNTGLAVIFIWTAVFHYKHFIKK